MSGAVVADAIDDLVAVVEAGLRDLRAQVDAAEAAADRAEARQRSLAGPDAGDRDRAELLRSTLGRMAAMGDAQQDAAIVAAEAHAAARVAAAQAEADDIVLQACTQLARRLSDERLPALPGPRGEPAIAPAPPPRQPRPLAMPLAPALAALASDPITAPVPHPGAAPPGGAHADEDGFAAFWRAEVDAEAEARAGSGLSSTLVGVIGALVLLALLLVAIG